ncbi:MAG TPA: hypothetical protein VFA50_20245 [Stellaceae bacterium]|nr:hypothetical protein [Stellaceae bacterium]
MAKAPIGTDLVVSQGGLIAWHDGNLYFIDNAKLEAFRVKRPPKKSEIDDYFARLKEENLLVPAAMVGARFHVFDAAMPVQPGPPGRRRRKKPSTP